MTGTAESATSAARGQWRVASRMTMTTKVAEFTMRNTRPKPTKRRIVEMSDVARDSSWPDCQPSWNETGSRWRCA